MLVGPGDEGPFEPMIDRRRVPGQRCDLVFKGRVIDVPPRKRGFDLERIEGAGLGGDSFLSDPLRGPRSFPDVAVGAVDVVGLHRPRLADGERRLDTAAVMGRVSPGPVLDQIPRSVINAETFVVGAKVLEPHADFGRRHLGDAVLPGRGDGSGNLIAYLVSPTVAGPRLLQ